MRRDFVLCIDEAEVMPNRRQQRLADMIPGLMRLNFTGTNEQIGEDLPRELAHLEQDNFETFSSQGGCGVAATWTPTDDEDLCMLNICQKCQLCR